MTRSERVVDTPHGPARLVTDRAPRPVGTLLLGHGAGGGIDGPDLTALATHLPRQGFTVVRLEQPWKVAGRRIAPAPRILDEGLVAASDRLRVRTPLVVGGRSAGARSAVRCGRRLGAVACLALAFPLHPPGKPEKSRLEELRGARLPTLVVQGERDAMGRPEEFPEDVEMTVVPGADHGFGVAAAGPLSTAEAMDLLVECTLEWLVREVTGNKHPG
ncbi:MULTISPECIES: alpha/beta family hydrolase [unclassified Nocardioides]|uniref:alpha/beta hydrolase family protein n=1 Tax=unclassified Nocardioides TaxID=2615069 RepID=UPI002665FBEC|nr:alpha/beta family hydrolase [Nocardioides sp. Arc9.136]WKN47374.1 hydrolase [Nocardioides sp. Arc9.136]